jgi:hypothetical protein
VDWLRDHPVAYELGLQTTSRARIVGLLGDRDEAAALFWQATGQPGFLYEPEWFYDFDADPIRDHPVFLEVLKPKE